MLTSTPVKDNFSLEDFVANPPDRMEWVDGQLVEKSGITLRHGEIQLRLACYWDDDKESSRQGGETYISVPCRTKKQGRSPDVAYLTPELVAQLGNAATLPQRFT